MAPPAQLTPGGVPAVSKHKESDGPLQPVLQVIDVRKVNSPQTNRPPGPASSDRFRMLLSDGVHSMQSMLATAMNHHVQDGYLKPGSIIHLLEFTCSTIQKRRIVIIIKLDVLQSECDIIGNAKPYEQIDPPTEQSPNLPANAAQVNSGPYSSGSGMLGSSVAPRVAPVANNVNLPTEQPYNLQANPAHVNTGQYSNDPGMLGSSVAPRAAQVANTVNLPTEQLHTHVTSGQYSSGPGVLGSSVAPRAPQAANNASYGGSYGGYLGPSIGRAVEPVPNVSSGGSYGTASAHNAMHADMVQPNLQQPSLNSHQNQRFAVPAMAGDSGTLGNTYGRPAQSFYQQPPPGHINRGPVTKNEATRAVVPVSLLNPYQDRWTIKARVTSKTDLRHYKNDKGPGKVFSFDLLDALGGEIRVTCFNLQADQFFDLIEVDKVYLISKGSLKPAQKKFNRLNHEYEITVDFRTSIEVCPSDDRSIPRQQYNFRQISEIENIEIGANVDLVGIVTAVSPSATITRKDGSDTQKRTLQLKDMSGRSVEVTFWGKFCDAEGQQLQLQCDSGLNPVLALKSVRVTEFNGRSVSSISSTQLKINPEDFPEAEKLEHWYVTEGKTAACVSLSVASMGKTDIRKTVAQIKDENLGRSEKPDWITVKGAISHVTTDNFCYPGCTLEVNGRRCNKKVINNGDGTWLCEKCGQSSPNCEYRYLLQCQIQDHTGLTYATAFQETGVDIIGHSAEELYNIKEDAEQFAEIIQGVRWQQFLFKLKVYVETYNDEQRIKCSIAKAEKLDPSRECNYVLKAIGALLQDDTGSPSEVQGAMAYNAGLNNSGAGQSVPASNSAYATSMGTPRFGESANQLEQQPNTYGGVSTPSSATRNVQTCMGCGLSGHNSQNCPAGSYRQQQPAVSTASSYGSSPGNAGSNLCYKCQQPGHYANACPGVGLPGNADSNLCYRCHQPGHYANGCPSVGAAPQQQQQQPYGSGVASGGYGPQSYVRATNC